DDACVAAWVRGARPGVNVHHGSPHGGGLLRVYDKLDKRELLERRRVHGALEAEWFGSFGAFSPLRGWRSGKSELRFSTWLARVHARAGRTGAALLAPATVFRRGVLAFGSSRVSSGFDLLPAVSVSGDGVLLESALAHRDGTRVEGTRLARSFRI